MTIYITWDEFERRLIEEAGWAPEDAKREREAQEWGELGDCDGDLGPPAAPNRK